MSRIRFKTKSRYYNSFIQFQYCSKTSIISFLCYRCLQVMNVCSVQYDLPAAVWDLSFKPSYEVMHSWLLKISLMITII